ncbi:MAG: hypothetical protein V4736_01400 [Bdellovibrionota bacterium]
MTSKLAISLILLASSFSYAESVEIPSTEVQIQISKIHRTLNLVDKRDEVTNTRQQLSVIVESPDLTKDKLAKENVYLTYLRFNEKIYLSAAFAISNQSIKFETAQRIGPGKYEVIIIEAGKESKERARYVVDASQLFLDEEKTMNWANDEVFISGPLETIVKVNRTVLATSPYTSPSQKPSVPPVKKPEAPVKPSAPATPPAAKPTVPSTPSAPSAPKQEAQKPSTPTTVPAAPKQEAPIAKPAEPTKPATDSSKTSAASSDASKAVPTTPIPGAIRKP